MELSVATDDFARFIKESTTAWKLIDDALERLNEDNQKNIDIGYQIKRLGHLLKSVSKPEDFQFHWESLKTCYESGDRIKKITTETQTDQPVVQDEKVTTLPVPSVRPTPPVSTSPASKNETDTNQSNTFLNDTNLHSNLQNNIQRQLAELLNSQMSNQKGDLFGLNKAGVLNGTSLLNGNMEKPDFQIESVETQSTQQQQPTQLNGSHTPLTMGDLPVNLLKTAADEQGLALGLYCYQCSTQFSDQFSFIEHLKTNELCKKMIRNVGLNYCFVCKKTYESVKKAKTHYTNYRNQGVNPHDLSRSLHRQWFDVIQFPTSRELENMSSTGTEVAPVQSAKCHGCQETFSSHDECIKHIGENSQCQIEIKHIGQTFCFVCERSYETEKQAETHYRNSIYNGHQLHRFHHRQYFNFVRQRKSPGRPPRSAESFSNGGVGRKPGLLENSLLNFSLSSFELANQAGLPSLTQMSSTPMNEVIKQSPLPTGIPPIDVNPEIKTEKKDEEDKDIIEIIDVRASQVSPNQVHTPNNQIPQGIYLNHTPPSTFNCPICQEQFPNENARFNHLSNDQCQCHHQLPEILKTSCLICQRDLLTEQKLSLHLRLHKNEWHKRYYEMFYRKRPGKRAAVDLNTATAPDLKRLMANIAV